MSCLNIGRLVSCCFCGHRKRVCIPIRPLKRQKYVDPEDGWVEELSWEDVPPDRLLFMCGCQNIPPEPHAHCIIIEMLNPVTWPLQNYRIHEVLGDYDWEFIQQQRRSLQT